MPYDKHLTAQYEVAVTTSDRKYAGTGSPIYYQFFGTKANTSALLAPGDRYQGRTDVLTFSDSTDIGEFKCLNIAIVGTDGWHIQEVRFSDCWVFRYTLRFVMNLLSCLPNLKAGTLYNSKFYSSKGTVRR